MRNFFKKTGQSGFTLVELMIVVAIIGILSAVAVPNFKRYQAKSKTTEAKIQLAAAYTAQQSFYGDFGMYSNCFPYMGYDPSSEIQSRYFAIGINQVAAINGVVHGTAVNSGLVAGDCPLNQAIVANVTYFLPGKGSAGVLGTLPAITGSALGTQAAGLQTFVMVAAGVVSADFINPVAASVNEMAKISVNENKLYSIVQPGF